MINRVALSELGFILEDEDKECEEVSRVYIYNICNYPNFKRADIVCSFIGEWIDAVSVRITNFKVGYYKIDQTTFLETTIGEDDGYLDKLKNLIDCLAETASREANPTMIALNG